MNQLATATDDFKSKIAQFIDGLVSHYVLDDGSSSLPTRDSKRNSKAGVPAPFREFCLYGETTGETDEFGLPVRYNWAADYRGQAMVVYGHTPVPTAEWVNRTICIDHRLRLRRGVDRAAIP